ncbi:hypothetical protein [Planctobacterium marinum]|uniref:hypothetical protein n=1 Tax=Planctobacterium marinum TaxID=1631968 RepID=UPI001E58A98C|nr:hypothetical protein [Planctobacterium marinum]MCC2608207.1 hypothetical protein [Planctobacterium marinum]
MAEICFNLAFSAMEKEIRHGLQPDNPALLDAYIAMADKLVEESNCQQQKINILHRVADNLLEVICDTYLAEHWRHCCLDVIYKPMLALEQLANCEGRRRQVLRLQREVNCLGQYFFS